MPQAAGPDRSLFLRVRIVAGLLAVLAAFDLGLAFQMSWAAADQVKLHAERRTEVEGILADIADKQRHITDLNQQAAAIIDEVLRQKAAETSKPSEPSQVPGSTNGP